MSEVRQNLGFPEGRVSAADLDELLLGVEGLPASAAAVGGLLALPDSPAAETAAAMFALVRGDVALAAGALAAANRTGPRVATIADACRALTPAGIRRLALRAQLLPPTHASGADIDFSGLGRHCLAVAHAAGVLAAEACPPIEPELAYTCGLLHDAGKWLLAILFPKTYQQVLDSVRLGQGDLLEAERRILGLDHALAGRRLARRWRLGEAVEESAWFSHLPLEAVPDILEHAPIVKLVALADVLVRENRMGFSGNLSFTRHSAVLADQLNIPAAAMARAVAEAGEADREAVREAARGPEASRVRSLSRANAELGKTCDALSEQVGALEWQAQALGRLQRLMQALPADATVRDVLTGLAHVLAEAAGGGCPAIVYYTGTRGAAQALRLDATNPQAWLTLPPSASPAPDETAPPAWAHPWLAPGEARHVTLSCGGQVVGGWIFPVPPGSDARVRQGIDALAPAAGVLLALAGARAAAIELGEALAGSAQKVALAQEAISEAGALVGMAEMAAGAAHEFNNPLAVISGRAQLLREKTDDELVRKTCQIIVDQSQRVSDIITSLMELATPAAPTPAPVDVAALLASAARAFYSSEHPKAASARVDIVCGLDTPLVSVDEQQIRAVLVEAITNAATAALDSPNITLTAETDEAGNAVILSVHDDGPGMDEQTKVRVFTPFFSAQRAGRRLGMGLPRARRYVQANRGRIWIQANEGEGTTVYVQLPQA